ncbi:MAG: type IV pili methyl-accepting chemotaxis transducer N-terminal domain-containing protein [Cytophagales bacterium]|nr:type IV pili methyl-accepting chemotaxis transducer N-terminal domain-containing protein [Cytophagales bacterium]
MRYNRQNTKSSMISIDQTVAKRLTLQYIVALSIVALLSIFGQVLIQVSLLDSSDNSHVINLAGRQRMLSQRLTKLTLLRSIKTQKWSPERQAEFENGFREWRKTHTGLRDNKLLDNKAYEVNNSPEIDAMFVEIKPYYNEMVKIFEQVNEGVEPTDKLISSLLENEKEFLHTMDKIVFEYDSKATKKVDRLRAFEFLIFILTILTLLIEFVYIFNPLVSYVRETIRQLLMSEKKLQIANNQLSQANKMLRDTQENLSKATK